MHLDDVRERAMFWFARGTIRGLTGMAAVRGDAGARLFLRRRGVDPFPLIEDLRDRGPLVPSMGGRISVDHAMVDAVFRSPSFGGFNSQPFDPEPSPADRALGLLMRAALFDPVSAIAGHTHVPSPIGPASLIGSEPPDHTRLRRAVSRAFLPGSIATWRHRIEAVASELADEALATARRDGGVDLVSAFAAPFPIQVICELLGVPVTDRDLFRPWGAKLAVAIDPMTPSTRDEAVVALEELEQYFLALFARRRRDPGDAVIDVLLAAHDDEPGLSDAEMMATTQLILLAGFETTVNLIGNGAYLLVRHPDQQQRLLDDPDLVSNAVEEVLRFDPPVQVDGRVAREDTVVAGHDVAKGTPVTLSILGANRDPAVFVDPHRFDVGRDGANRHLAFAAGIHYCLGAALARVEGDVAFRVLLDRFGGFAAAGPARRRPTFTLSGFDQLVVGPAARTTASLRT